MAGPDGKNVIDYALYPHQKGWKDAQTLRRGYEYNEPMMVAATGRHRGRYPLQYSFVSLAPSNLVLTTIKKAEDSNAWVLQWYDAKGKGTIATVTLPSVPKKVTTSNFLEEDGRPMKASGKTVKVPTRKNGIGTIKVYF